MLGGKGHPLHQISCPASAGNSSQAGDREFLRIPRGSRYCSCVRVRGPSPCLQRRHTRERKHLSEAWGPLHDEEAFAKKDAGFGAGWVQTWGLPWEAGAQVQAPGWAQAGCVLRATHRRLRCSRGAAPPLYSPCPDLGCPPYLPARVGWAKLRCGRLPTGLGPDPWPWRGRVGVCGGTGRAERQASRAGRGWHAPCWAGAESSAAATPEVKRSGPEMVQPTSWETNQPRGFRSTLGVAGGPRDSPGMETSQDFGG